MKAYCPRCKMERESIKIQRQETYPVKGEPITIMASVKVCNVCGTDIFDESLDSENLALAYSRYREQKGLPGPEDIRRIRGRYGLSQRGMAALLGWSPATIARYEAGAIPSVPHSEQLRRFDEDISYAYDLFKAAKNKLGNLERRRVEKAFSSFGTIGISAEERVRFLRDELMRFIREIVNRMHPRKVMLFGSLAAGKVQEWSDLDLVVIANTTLPFLDRIKEIMRQFHPKVGMDILVYTPEEWETLVRERPFIREEILGKGKIVYERPDDSLA
ncbi:MAG TPA: type II toxin-antitoxin system MqsA family antitoxin [Firmicutes bacterium]|nr:type II toxin-antitoxin system MqsA family antitoxin [Bacillota bacterium]